MKRHRQNHHHNTETTTLELQDEIIVDDLVPAVETGVVDFALNETENNAEKQKKPRFETYKFRNAYTRTKATKVVKSTVLPILGRRNSTSTKEGPRQKFGSIVSMKETGNGERQHGGGGSALRSSMTYEENKKTKFSLPTQKFRNQ